MTAAKYENRNTETGNGMKTKFAVVSFVTPLHKWVVGRRAGERASRRNRGVVVGVGSCSTLVLASCPFSPCVGTLSTVKIPETRDRKGDDGGEGVSTRKVSATEIDLC